MNKGLKPIPAPSRLPLVGHAHHFLNKKVLATINEFCEDFAGLYELTFPQDAFYIASNHRFVKEFLDTTRFRKCVTNALKEIREITGDGLFTAHTEEINWEAAHSILSPGFNMKAMKNYVTVMNEVAEELCGKWLGLGSVQANVSEDMTRYTLETIGRSCFSHSFDSFESDELHPFVGAMVRSLAYSMGRSQLLGIQRKLTFFQNRSFQKDKAFLDDFVSNLVTERMAQTERPQDLLTMMLENASRKSGQRLPEKNISHQLITFLIAGHETTSALLSFTLYLLVKHPEILAQVRSEVDTALEGHGTIQITDIPKLHLLNRVIRESLRLYPTAPGFFVMADTDEVVGGEYIVKGKKSIFICLYKLHRDPAIWGSDAESFDPDRFTAERFREIPVTAYRPFGNGPRSCIGQNFAMVEATIMLAKILQRFDLIDVNNYQLEIMETMTIKPDNFHLEIRPRLDLSSKDIGSEMVS